MLCFSLSLAPGTARLLVVGGRILTRLLTLQRKMFLLRTILSMTEIVKPFTIIDTVTEPDGNTGVKFLAQKTTYEGSVTRAAKMSAYISIAPGADIDAEVYAFLQTGGWV